jgi:SAM-dependent methyltransferase
MPFKNVDFLVADVSSLPLRHGCIHKALMNQVLEHVDRPLDAFSETSRVLRNNGIFVISTPYAPFLERYKFPITELLRKILPRNLRYANDRFLIGSFIKKGYVGWMHETGHLTLGFSLSQIQDMAKSAELTCGSHDYLHKGVCVWLWELGYCLPFASFALRPLSMLLYALERKSSKGGLDIICKLEKEKIRKERALVRRQA